MLTVTLDAVMPSMSSVTLIVVFVIGVDDDVVGAVMVIVGSSIGADDLYGWSDGRLSSSPHLWAR